MSAHDDEFKPAVVNDQDVDDYVDNDVNSDEQLARDEDEAIDQDNITSDKGHSLRHAKPQTKNAYNEGPDEDDLPKEVLEDTY
ncbi:hypothetical protein N7454_001636 [Penicillium verhagenii]|nr:hypothetical protein N7454_001636 [Penicillium verhagenii]